jgi:hypothetical protein
MPKTTDHPSFLNPNAVSENTEAIERQKSMEMYCQFISERTQSDLEALQLAGESSQRSRRIARHDSPIEDTFLCKSCLILANELAILEQELKTAKSELEKLRAEGFAAEQASGLCVQKLGVLQSLLGDLEDEKRNLQLKVLLLQSSIDVARDTAHARIWVLESQQKQDKGRSGIGDRGGKYRETNAELIEENTALKKALRALRDENVKIKKGWFEERRLDRGMEMGKSNEDLEKEKDVYLDGLTLGRIWQEWWRGIKDLLLRCLGSCDKILAVGFLVGVIGLALVFVGQVEGGEL